MSIRVYQYEYRINCYVQNGVFYAFALSLSLSFALCSTPLICVQFHKLDFFHVVSTAAL